MKTNLLVKSLVITSVIAGSGCTTLKPIDNCAELQDGSTVCASYEDAYYASLNANKESKSDYIYEDLPDAIKNNLSEDGELVLRHKEGFASPPYAGAPVWQPGQAYRMWAAPSKGGEILTGGEYVYFSTPGRFNYGTLKRNGDASGMFKPLSPEDLGFQPVDQLPSGAVKKNQSMKEVEKRTNQEASLKNIGNLY